ncbi:UDP-glucose 4-epimerase GalE, partial [Priestia megaterium]|uniref:UDP-glucose 4-epimerase GalE n=1 Tax=Priestia megaterium TaxID=1404 RepID=UPI003008669C
SHTCVELLNAGYEIIVLDNFSNSSPRSLERVKELTNKSFKIYDLDILEKVSVEKVFQENDIKAVIHFAGLKAVGESVELPIHYYYNNISGTLNLIDVMQKHKVFNIVFSSSATVYGMPKQVPISENSTLSAMNPYGRTKLMVEEILNDVYISNNNWGIALLRYFNPIGAHESGRIGEDPNGTPNNLMPFITQVAIGKLNELKVFGNDYSTSDGTGVRDYIHVVDVAKGHLKALAKVMNFNGVEAYNLGTGQGYSVLEMIAAFEEACARKVPYSIAPRRPGDIGECFADPTKAEKELEWKAEKGIKEMCIDSWNWQSQNPNGFLDKKSIADYANTLT